MNTTVLVVLDEIPSSLKCLPDPVPGQVILVPAILYDDWQWFTDAGYRAAEIPSLLNGENTAETGPAVEEIISRIWRTAVKGRPLESAMVYGGIRLSSVMHTFLATGLMDSFTRVDAVNAWIEQESPSEILIPRTPGPWGTAAQELARAREIPVRYLSGIPERVPFWPPTRRSVTQLLPRWIARWRDRRQALAHRATYQVPEPQSHQRQHKDILVPAHYPADVRTLGPVVQRLRRQGVHYTAMVVDTQGSALSTCGKMSVPHFLLQAAEGWEDAEHRVRRGVKDLGGIWRAFLDAPADDNLRYRGVSVTALMARPWRAFADVTLEHMSLRQFLWWAELIVRAIQDYTPQLILTADEAMPFPATVLEAARLADIPTLCVLHGAMPDHPKHRASRATTVAVSGDLTRRRLIAKGTDPDRIALTGLPQLDPLADRTSLERMDIAGEFGVPSGKPVVVYTMLSGIGVTPLSDVIAATAEVLGAARALKERCTFIFKRHPADRGDLMRNQMNIDPASFGVVDTLDAPIHPLLWNADLVITQMSTTGQEALILDKRLIVVNLSGKPDSIPYVEYGAALGVYERGVLEETIGRALDSAETQNALEKGRERFVMDFAHKVDGKAVERITDLVDDLLLED